MPKKRERESQKETDIEQKQRERERKPTTKKTCKKFTADGKAVICFADAATHVKRLQLKREIEKRMKEKTKNNGKREREEKEKRATDEHVRHFRAVEIAVIQFV